VCFALLAFLKNSPNKFSKMISLRSFRKLIFSKKFFSTTNDLVSPQHLVALFKHGYGQAGTLNTKISNPKTSIHLKTIWEDHAAISVYSKDPSIKNRLSFREEDKICYLEDSNSGVSEAEAVIVAEIPEYYSLNLANSGDVAFIKGDVSSKLCGNVSANMAGSRGNLSMSKIKGEYFHLNTEGNFKITSYLEAADFLVNGKNAKIDIKRLGLSGNGRLNYINGEISIGSVYCGTYQGHASPAEPVISLTNDTVSSQELLDKVVEQMKKGHYLDIAGSGYKFSSTNFQSSCFFRGGKSTISLGNTESQRIVIDMEEGNVSLTVSKLTTEGVIRLKKGSLHLGLEDPNRLNIFLWKEKAFWRGNFVNGRPILVVHAEDASVVIEQQQKKDFFAEMRERMKNVERK
jgi:hypothetical protein